MKKVALYPMILNQLRSADIGISAYRFAWPFSVYLPPVIFIPRFMASLRIPRILSLVGLALVVTGITFKLNELMGAETVFNAGAVVLVLGLLLWAMALLRAKQ